MASAELIRETDDLAEREGEALRRARKHRSVFMVNKARVRQMDEERATFEEMLETIVNTCQFCGVILRSQESHCRSCAFVLSWKKRYEEWQRVRRTNHHR